MTEWKKELCQERPLELQVIAPNLYMERKNINEVTLGGIEGDNTYTAYECDCREISFDEYRMLKAIEAIKTDEAIDAYTLLLIEEGAIR